MATAVDGAFYTLEKFSGSRYTGKSGYLSTFGTQTVTYYVMRAVDNNANTSPPTYRIWTVANNPDYGASYYAGPFSGTGINFSSADVLRIETI